MARTRGHGPGASDALAVMAGARRVAPMSSARLWRACCRRLCRAISTRPGPQSDRTEMDPGQSHRDKNRKTNKENPQNKISNQKIMPRSYRRYHLSLWQNLLIRKISHRAPRFSDETSRAYRRRRSARVRFVGTVSPPDKIRYSCRAAQSFASGFVLNTLERRTAN